MVKTTIKDEKGPFKITVICETPGVNMDLRPVVKTGDLVLQAISVRVWPRQPPFALICPAVYAPR